MQAASDRGHVVAQYVELISLPIAVAPASQPSDQPGHGHCQPQADPARAAAAVGTAARLSRGRGLAARVVGCPALSGRHWAHWRWGRTATRCLRNAKSTATAGRGVALRRENNAVGQAGLVRRDRTPSRRDAADVREIEAAPARRARLTSGTVHELGQTVHDRLRTAGWRRGRRTGLALCAGAA